MDRSVGIFVLFALVSWIGGLLLSPDYVAATVQPIDFNHSAHADRVACQECHFRCDKNRDEDGDVDCEGCEESEVFFCDEHLACPDHKLPGLPQTEVCVRCHEEDLVALNEAEGEPPEELRRKAVLLEYVEFDEYDEPVASRAIPWRRVTSLPTSNVYFSHRTHAVIQQIDCALCHGDSAAMERPPAHPAVTIDMEWCLECHQSERKTTQCASCHR